MRRPSRPPGVRDAGAGVDVWVVRVDEALPHLDRLAVSGEERARADAFRRDEDRRRHLAAHGVLRHILSGELGVPAAALAFDRTCRRCGDPRHGKPRVAGREDARFSLSHSGDLVLVALGRSREVGVDVERVDPGLDAEAVARVSLSPAERHLLSDAPPSRFYDLWTRKEACLKLTGEGLARRPDALDLSKVPAQGGVLALPDGTRVCVVPLVVGAGHAAALAVEGESVTVRLHLWRP
jgi:4'-phosphopantetheinyl transferase